MASGPLAAAAAVAVAAAVLAMVVAGCASAGSAGTAAATGSPSLSAPGKVTLPSADGPACAQLLARLQQVTQAIGASSELIASSRDKQQLSQRIAVEAKRMRQSAQLMGEGPIPVPLAAADRQLVTALRTFSGDFARAKGAARRGDFQAAVDAMGDKPAVQKIVGASTTIQHACTPRGTG
jgi:hypothetical protein